MHTVAIIQVSREDWAKRLKKAIVDAAQRSVSDPNAIQFVSVAEGADLVLCLGSDDLSSSVQAKEQIKSALEKGIRILPIVSDLEHFRSETPESLHPINGQPWESGGKASEIAEEVLRHLGLNERDRRVFLSYLRKEATPIAFQLFDELHRRRFTVFLDIFEIEHGDWVQARIEQALQHTSFVLLLYSSGVQSSEWVEKEINLALTQRLGLVALAYPDAGKSLPFKMVPCDRRLQLDPGDLDKEKRLSPQALEKVCLEIEREHADQFRARRERLIHDVSEALGPSAVRVGSQSLRYDGKNSKVFVRLVARPPEASDLYALDEECPIDDERPEIGPLRRVLVAVKGGYRENRDLTEWVCKNLKHSVGWREPQVVCFDPGVLET
jgi:TIR domain-containing protein